jgi:hypothetical protein
MVLSISFYGFNIFFSNFGSKFKGASLQFYRKCQFMAKTNQNSVFLGRKAHIPDRLHKMATYINFYGF